MILYHLDKWRYRDVWPPEGALFAEGRWNKLRQWVIYSSPSISLAKLEILANTNSLPSDCICMTIEVSDNMDIQSISKKSLPENWMNKPYPTELVRFTSKFISLGKLLMQVPSAQSHNESNYLINVRHPDFHEQVKMLQVTREPFDSRLK